MAGKKVSSRCEGCVCAVKVFLGARFIISGRADRNWLLKSWQTVELFQPGRWWPVERAFRWMKIGGFGMITHVCEIIA